MTTEFLCVLRANIKAPVCFTRQYLLIMFLSNNLNLNNLNYAFKINSVNNTQVSIYAWLTFQIHKVHLIVHLTDFL